MRRKRDLRYLPVQRCAVDLLWTAIDFEDKSMLFLMQMLIRHCDEQLGKTELPAPLKKTIEKCDA